MRKLLRIFVTAGKSWSSDNAFKHSAAVSFYTLFSMAPITVIAVTIASFFMGYDEASRQFNEQMVALVGKSGAETIQTAVKASQAHKDNIMSTAVGIGVLLVGATTVFGQLQDSLNSIWNVRTSPKRAGWLVIIMQRLISFAMVVTVGFLLLVSLVLTTALTVLTARFNAHFSLLFARGADIVIAFVVIAALFAMIFKIMPDVQLRWRDVYGSALLTSGLFSGGRYLIALYLGHSTVASIYGAAGSLVALLIWVYYSCAILFFGVEFTRAWRIEHHLPIIPKATAIAVREKVEVERPTRTPARARNRGAPAR